MSGIIPEGMAGTMLREQVRGGGEKVRDNGAVEGWGGRYDAEGQGVS